MRPIPLAALALISTVADAQIMLGKSSALDGDTLPIGDLRFAPALKSRLGHPGASLAPSANLAKKPGAPSTDIYFRNCAAVRATGVAPLYRDQLGYRPPIDV